MNEADTRATLIEPNLKAAGWTDRYVTREYYYQRDHQYAPGRIILVGNQVRRGRPRRVDYLLRLTEGLPIAVVEAKADTEPAEAGLEQAKRYAAELGLAFAYATNGRDIMSTILPCIRAAPWTSSRVQRRCGDGGGCGQVWEWRQICRKRLRPQLQLGTWG